MYATERTGNCSLGCPNPGSHASFAECMNDKGAKVAYANSAGGFDYTAQKAWDRNLDAYADAKRQGIQPATTQRKDVEQAVILSDHSGSAFQA